MLLAEGAHIKHRRRLSAAPRAGVGRDRAAIRFCTPTWSRTTSSAVIGVERIGEAEASGLGGARRPLAPSPEVRAGRAVRAWRGRAACAGCPSTTCARASTRHPQPRPYLTGPRRTASPVSGSSGAARLDEARTDAHSVAGDRRRARRGGLVRLAACCTSCELALRAGAWEEASRLLDEWAQSADRDALLQRMYERCRALLAAGRGHAGEAERVGGGGDRPRGGDRKPVGMAGGRCALADSRPCWWVNPHARPRLCESSGRTRSARAVDEPGVFPAAPDLVEALAELGELDEAHGVTAPAERAGRTAGASRGGSRPSSAVSAVLRLASTAYDGDAASALAESAADYGRLGLRFDEARSLLSLGRAQRRFRKWGAARESLSTRDCRIRRTRVSRLGRARRAPSSPASAPAARHRAATLTQAEQRTAEMAAAGLSNKEIARGAVSSPCTRSRSTSRAPTPSSACARARSWRAA